MKLDLIIANLLKEHNCVIVPEFGGFIANYKSAVVDQSKKRILPPSKSILFNSQLLTNDGLLAARVGLEKAVNYEDALKFINRNVAGWKDDLSNGNRIEIGEIGFLYQQNGQIAFEQNRELNLLLSAYGMGSISFVTFDVVQKDEPIVHAEVKKDIRPVVKLEPVKKVEQEEIVETNQIEKPIAVKKDSTSIPIVSIETYQTKEKTKDVDDKIIVHPKSKKWKYLVAAAAIPFFFYAYWIPMETDFLDTGQIQMSDFNPIHHQAEKAYVFRTEKQAFDTANNDSWKTWEDLTEQLSENVSVYNYQFADELYIPVRLTTEVKVNEPEDIEEHETISEGSFYVIAGCFSVKENANSHVDDLNRNGYSAHILDQNKGLHRVTIGGFASRDDAKNALEKLKGKGYSGWILSN